ncbi:galactosyltransferase-related protein [Tamlana crocina]
MLTIALTYRNRDLNIVSRCFQSLKAQSNSNFKVMVVDYGSTREYSQKLKRLCDAYNFISYIFVNAVGQLWNKSRSINIALKQCETPLFCVADIDLLFHPEFVDKSFEWSKNNQATYFQTGFLSKETTQKNLSFNESQPQFLSTNEVTGITLYQTELLKLINGYDEFYHGWGAEDTDVHLRLKNAGHQVCFYDKEVLVKHQWHPKAYRTKASSYPFHTGLERINHQYMLQRQQLHISKANIGQPWGVLPSLEQKRELKKDVTILKLSNQSEEIDALLVGLLPQLKTALKIQVHCVQKREETKQFLKQLFGKKSFKFYSLEQINNKCLETLIVHQRLALYNFKTDWKSKTITLSISPYAEA